MRDVVIAACGLAIVALLVVIAYENHQRFHKPLLTTTYQAETRPMPAFCLTRMVFTR